MAVVNQTSDLFRDAHALEASPDPLKTKGRLMVATGTVTNEASDSSASMYRLIELPSDCYLHEGTFFDVAGDGFAQIVIGTRDDTDALVDQTKATENIITPIAIGDAFHGKQLWEILGMSEDPAGFIALFKHAEAAATVAGSMDFRIIYIWR